MYIPERLLLKHWRKARCFKNTEVRIKQRDLEDASWYEDMELSLIVSRGKRKSKE